MVDSAIITRLKKVQALTTSSNPNEAAVAAEKLQELLVRYNLELADVSGDVNDGRPSRVYGKHEAQTPQSEYRRLLMNVLAINNFCRYVYTPGTTIAWLVGETHNVEAVRWMFATIDEQLKHMVWRAYKAYVAECEAVRLRPAPARTWKRDYRVGAVLTIGERLRSRAEALRAEEAVNALVVVSDAALKSALHDYFPRLRSGAKAVDTTTSGFAKGRVDGNAVTLEKTLKG